MGIESSTSAPERSEFKGKVKEAEVFLHQTKNILKQINESLAKMKRVAL